MNNNLADTYTYLALYDEQGLYIDVKRLSPAQAEQIAKLTAQGYETVGQSAYNRFWRKQLSSPAENSIKRYAEIIARLTTARINAGLSQSQVAAMLGFDTGSTISQYENNHRKLDLDMFLRMAKLYDVSEAWLLTGHNPDFDEQRWLELTETSNATISDLNKLKELIRSLRQDES